VADLKRQAKTMPRLFILLVGMLIVSARAENATAERFVTIEQWGSRGQVATVWAVTPSKITVYEVEASERDKLLRVVSIEKNEEEKLRRLTAAIPTGSRGKVWLPRGVFDGIMMRISFSADGSFRDDRIEVQNHWRPEFEDLVAAISEQMPADLKITFKEVLERMSKPVDIPIVGVPIKEYYRGP
jgi:hypothetical protein